MKPALKTALRELAASRLEVPDADVSEVELRRILRQIALSPASKPADRLRAVELLGKAMGMFDEVQDRRPSFADLVLAAQRLREAKRAAQAGPEL